MLPTIKQLRELLGQVIVNKREQGHVCLGLEDRLAALPERYDELLAFAETVSDLPMQPDWPHVEPSDWKGIVAQMAPDRPQETWRRVSLSEAVARVQSAFLGSVCGCVLGKPLEIKPTLAQLRESFTRIGDWPLNDYVSQRVAEQGGLKLNPCWTQTVRERIGYVAPDDDINYTILGALLLQKHGQDFTPAQVLDLWIHNLAPAWTFGPERTMLLHAGVDSMVSSQSDFAHWVRVLNPGEERCGAMIRADAYGYAFPGNPQKSVELAWRDASWTHRRTGIYGTMFAAAAISVAPVAREPMEIFDMALRFVPQRSRFASIVSDAIEIVRQADNWMQAYERIHERYGRFGHCLIYQETATLVNTLRFATSVGHGICLQVMQGNDTDSYAATAGSILGAYFGPGHLEDRWLAPFNDTIHTTLADFHVQSLSQVTRLMGDLPVTMAARQTEKC